MRWLDLSMRTSTDALVSATENASVMKVSDKATRRRIQAPRPRDEGTHLCLLRRGPHQSPDFLVKKRHDLRVSAPWQRPPNHEIFWRGRLAPCMGSRCFGL